MKLKIILLFLIMIVIFPGAILFKKYISAGEKIQKQTRFLLDTYCTIQVPGDKKDLKIIDKALDRVEEINIKFNVLNPESPLYDFNQKNMPISDAEIIGLIKIALKVSEESSGAFDITVYPLVKLWGFFDDKKHVPAKEEIKECLKNIGYKQLAVKDGKLIKTNYNVKIDLGAIAKGYAVDEALKVLKKEGIKSALIDLGGDIYALGKLKNKNWRVGIREPRGKGLLGVLELTDTSLSTSGDYERFFEKDGIRYHHLLDPKTGYPAKGVESVTVISPDATLADAWSTALFVMGKDKAMELVEKTTKAETIIVTDEGNILYSSGLKKNLTILKKEKKNDE